MENKFTRFFAVGVVSTLVDWTVFYVLSFYLNYIVALIIAILLGGIVNYILNKIYSFDSKTKQYIKQYGVHLFITAFSIAISSGLVFLLVENDINKLVARVIVTFIMLFFNYLLHSGLTYNKKIWSEKYE